jgi:hypothetical protein
MATITPQEAEGLYGITLTEHEKMLLTTTKELLRPIERQEQYILRMALEPVKCPACPLIISRRSAIAGGVFDMRGSIPDNAYECPNCHVKLTWHIELFGGGQFFSIQPGQTVTVK